MTDEDAFQAALDLRTDDHFTSLVFADWLEERGDVRADGYRALGRREWYPVDPRHNDGDVGWTYPGFTHAKNWAVRVHMKYDRYGQVVSGKRAYLPNARFNVLESKFSLTPRRDLWFTCDTRREVEDQVTACFMKLGPRTRHRILNPKKGK